MSDRTAIVFNRSTIQSANPTIPHIVIQITDSQGTEFPPLSEEAKRTRKGVLQLRFEDMDSLPGIYGRAPFNYILFEKEHAKKILDFVFKEHKDVPLVLVHCEAGISRSPATAASLTKIFGKDDADFFKFYMPNRLVYSTILETAAEEGLIG